MPLQFIKMAISFYLQSKKNPAPIYVRIREGVSIDAKAKTNFSINPERFEKGSVKKVRVPSGAGEVAKAEVQKENTIHFPIHLLPSIHQKKYIFLYL